MALMFQRIARNFARNGYFPTDEASLERVLQALSPASAGRMRVLDPCAGEGAAIAELAHHLGRERVQAYGVEYHAERAASMQGLVDRGLQGDLMDTVISPRSVGCLWLNPPYGDLLADHAGYERYQGKGRRRLEKLFYQRTVGTLQYGGVMVLIVPDYALDKELTGWLVNHFTELRVFRAAVDDFQQVVILGCRVRRREAERNQEAKAMRAQLLRVGGKEVIPEVIPEVWPFEPYAVPAAQGELRHFYRVSLDAEQLADEVGKLQGLWPGVGSVFGKTGLSPRPPVRRLSSWHLALSLAAGAISGVVTVPSGRCLVVKGNTHKDKVAKTEFTEGEDGSITETRVLTDRFVPVIRAWEMTPDSPRCGQLLTITSTPAASDGEPDAGSTAEDAGPDDAPAPLNRVAERAARPDPRRFDVGRVVMTRTVNELVERGEVSPMALLRRHVTGDWGDVPEEDRQSNEQALIHGDRLLSSYRIGESLTVWIITEADRSATTLLLPDDY